MPSTSTTGPARDAESGWSELAFDLTAIALGLVWLAGTGYVALLGLAETLVFFGETATPEEVAESRRLFRLAAVIAVAVPLIGLLLSLGLRRKRFGILFAVLLLFGSGFAGLVGLDAYRSRPADPVEPGPRTCQESSGGDNRCPGG
ncbi:MAG TPA: hypothetical protein VE617_09570 [Propionibacteriaceae bacterium]|nr:hypothetical protein [Propionibacteriaceae bacterium]